MMFRKTKAELIALVSSVDNRLSAIEKRLSAKIEQQECRIKALCKMVADLEETLEITAENLSDSSCDFDTRIAILERKNKPAKPVKPAKKKVSK